MAVVSGGLGAEEKQREQGRGSERIGARERHLAGEVLSPRLGRAAARIPVGIERR
jgi:hypothetical protein